MQNWFSAPRFRGVLVLSLLNIHLSYFWNLKFYDYDSPWELNKCLVKNDEIVHNSQTQLEQVFQSGWCFGFPTVGKTSSWSVVGRTWRTTPSFWLFTPGSSFDLQELVVNSSTRRKYFFFCVWHFQLNFRLATQNKQKVNKNMRTIHFNPSWSAHPCRKYNFGWEILLSKFTGPPNCLANSWADFEKDWEWWASWNLVPLPPPA